MPHNDKFSKNISAGCCK